MTNSACTCSRSSGLSRRSFLTMSAVMPLALRSLAAPLIPVGLELYSVREALNKDLNGTLKSVAQMGYQCVEFYAPYFDWTEGQTKDVRKLLDDLWIRCLSRPTNTPHQH